ncbi:MAG: TonB-dependent receptor [Myxococcaceae bacterium]
MNRSPRLHRLSRLATLLALLPTAALAIGEQNGGISGIVTEAATGIPVPGVTVAASSKALIGGPKTTTTGEDGQYSLSALPPGSYTVEISYEGVKPIRREIEVIQGSASPLNVAWSAELAETETTVVVQERKLTRPDSTQSGSVLSAETQGKLASARRYQWLAQQVAGVSGNANPNIRGGNELMNRYMIDGLDVTDPVSNGFTTTVNFDSISSLQILTGGMEAQYNAMGGALNLITSTGSDEFHVDSSIYMNHSLLSAPSQYGPNAHEGIQPFSRAPRPPTSGFDANANVSGPIIKQKLWFNFSLQYSNNSASLPSGPPLNVQGPNRTLTGVFPRLKLTYGPSSKHRLTLSALSDPTMIDNVDATSGTGNSITPLAHRRTEQSNTLGTLIWEYFANDAVTAKVQLGGVLTNLNNGPQGKYGRVDYNSQYTGARHDYDYGRSRHVNADDGTIWYNPVFDINDRRTTGQLDGSLAFKYPLLGHHETQVGIQNRISQRGGLSQFPGGHLYQDRDGGPGEAGLCLDEATGKGCSIRTDMEPFQFRESGFSTGVYVQDRWQVTRWLRVLPGLRFDHGRTRDSSGNLVSMHSGLGPRLGLIADLTGDQKTIVSAFYGRANEVMSLMAAQSANRAPQTSYLFNAQSKRWDFLESIGGPGTTTLDPHGRPPHTDEILLSFRRQLSDGIAANLDYTYKRISNIWDQVETNYVWDPTGTRIVDYVNGQPGPVYKITTPADNYVTYQGLDVVLQGRVTPNFDLYAAYTLGFRYGPAADQLGVLGTRSQYFNDRQAQYFDGYAFGDIRHMVKVNGTFTAGNFSIGANTVFLSGEVQAKNFQTATAQTGTILRTPMGTTPTRPNDVEQVSEFRTADRFVIDFRVAYDLHGWTGQHIILIGDVFNVLNLAAPLGYNAADRLPPNTFGTVASRQQPFRVQLGLRYMY